MWNKQRYCWQLQNNVWIQNFRRVNWKNTILGKYSYFFVVLRFGGSCQEMCGKIMWVGKQDDSKILQSIYSMHRWPSLRRGRIEICRRIVKSMLSNCSEILALGTYWKTWYSMVSEQTCTIDYKMDQSMWQTLDAFDLIHSSHKWIPTILSCEKHSTTKQAWISSIFWFCRRSRRLKISNRRTLKDLRKSNICAKKLDLQETDISLTQLNRSRVHISWCRSLGSGDWSLSLFSKPNQQIQKWRVTGKPVA